MVNGLPSHTHTHTHTHMRYTVTQTSVHVTVELVLLYWNMRGTVTAFPNGRGVTSPERGYHVLFRVSVWAGIVGDIAVSPCFYFTS